MTDYALFIQFYDALIVFNLNCNTTYVNLKFSRHVRYDKPENKVLACVG